MRQVTKWSKILLVTVGVGLGCSSSSRKLDLLPHQTDDGSAERERLQRLQMVRAIDHTDPENPIETNFDPEVLMEYFRNGVCQKEQIACEVTDCNVCQIDYALCVANHLLDVAGTRAAPVELELTQFQPSHFLSIPAQGTATNAALAKLAFLEYAPRAMHRAFTQLRVAVGLPDLPAIANEGTVACTASQLAKRINPGGVMDTNPATVEPGSVTVAAALGDRASEAYWVYREAGLRAVELDLAMADEQRANPSVSFQISRGVAGEEFSRVSAAHLLVGGSVGLLGSTTDTPRAGLCSVPDLTAQGEAALNVLRDAGVSPEAVVASPGTVSLDQLLNGSVVQAVPGGSVKQRLSQRWGFNFDAPPAGIEARGSIADYFHLRAEDFEEARRYLSQEIVAFSRSMTAQIEPPPVANGYRRFAATAQPPRPVPAAYYAAISGYEQVQPSQSASQPILTEIVTTLPGGGQQHLLRPLNLARGTEAAFTQAAEVLEKQSSISSAAIRNDLMTPLATMLAGDPRAGRAQFCRWITGSSETIDVNVAGFKSTDGVAVVRGEDGLRCATEGTIEGARCDSNFKITPTTTVDQALKVADISSVGVAGAGFKDAASGSFTINQRLNNSRVYVVVRNTAGSSPGSYKALVGFHLAANTENSCFDVPIVPEVSARVADIMAPNPKWCAGSQVTCAGTQFDERLPLEDELSSDSDGVESSWRHYLELAKQAAARSDLLGQEYIQNGLEVDSRMETVELRDDQQEQLAEDKALAAIDELQDTCGTAVDPIRLLKLLSTGTEKSDLNLIRDAQVPPCKAGYKQVLNQCVFDLSQLLTTYRFDPAYPDLVRLNNCLSSDSVKEYVHLGSKARPVCFWHELNDPRAVCQGADKNHPCPVLAGSVGGEDWSCSNLSIPGTLSTKVAKEVRDTLELVETTTIPTFQKTSNASPLGLCDQIRQLRNGPDPEALANVTTNATLFSALRMTEVAQRIGFRARYGSYSAITVDGGTRYTTGNAWTAPSPNPQWPCAASGALGCPGAGLLCDQADCTNETDRARMNDRLARAVLGINASLGNARNGRLNLTSVVWPAAYPRHMVNPNADAVLNGATQRDFHVDATTLLPVTEYTSAHGPIHAENGLGYAASGLTAANRAYVYFPDPGSPTSALIATDGIASDRVLIFAGSSLNDDYESLQLELRPGVDKVVNSSFDKKDHVDAAKYFWDNMSPDGQPPGYYRQKLEHRSNLGAKSVRELPPNVTGDHTQHFWLKFNYEERAMLDALELLCEADAAQPLNCAPPPEIATVADLPAAAKSIECIAEQIKRAAAVSVLSKFPVQALDPLRRQSGVTSSTTGGSVGVDIGQLRGALADLADVPVLMSDQLKQLAAGINGVYLAVQDGDLSKKLSDVELQSTMANQIATCLAAATPSASIGSGASITINPGAIITCGNSFAQIGFAQEINSLTRQKIDLGITTDLNGFTSTFSTIATGLGQLANRLSSSLNQIDAQLLAIEQQHNKAKLALVKALHVRSFTSQFEAKINAVHHARFQTSRIRYEQAHVTAQKMAFLAKRAIEMRLGVKLSELTETLPLVDPPATWESTVCATTGVNYANVAEGAVLNYADSFIGDYVDKLESVVESYRLVNNFHEGSDVAIVSLKNDVQNARALCEVEVSNELLNAGQLGVGSSETSPGWDRAGCGTTQVNSETVDLPNCIGILGEDVAPILGVPRLSTAEAYRLRFGDLGACPSASCGYRTGATLQQEVSVAPGTYRASVYVRDRALFSDVGLQMKLDGQVVTGLAQATQPATLTSWPRVYVKFKVSKPQTLSFGFARPVFSAGGAADEIVLAAPMLERLPAFDTQEIGEYPIAFANTSETRTRTLPACEDTSGEVFRSTAWRRGTANLCPDGFGGDCAGATARSVGFWETSFSINQRDIESGKILGNSGFAKGNFNYRLDKLSVNFVGTSVRNCSESDTPSSCYGSGFVPYSLVHNGPYTVRNYQGKDFRADLFTGRIENARGLATERYLTSPLSSTDRELLTDYQRLELQGRPLDGNFVLRVWDDPGVDFSAIEDVQLVVDYRYWTRFN